MKKQSINEIIVHVGLHKTATSSIQGTLSDKRNQKLLTKSGFLYPNNWPINHSVTVYSAFCEYPERYHINVRQKLTRDQVDTVNMAYLHDLEKEVALKCPEKLIISGEDISLLDLYNLQRFRDYLLKIFNPSIIRAIVYVRNPVSLSVSKMQEDIKSGLHTISSSFSIDLQSKEHSIKKRLVDIEKVFSKKCTEVYSFDDAVKNTQGPVGHFLSVVGFNEENGISKFYIERSNESLSLLAANIISFINCKYPLFKGGVINEPRKSGDTLLLTKLKGEKFDLLSHMKKELLDKYHNEIVWLNDYWGIDYHSSIEDKVDQTKVVISRAQLMQLIEIHAGSSEIIQDLIIEFLIGIDRNNIAVSYSELDNFLSKLGKIREANSQKILSEDKFRYVLGIDDAIESAEIYREIALLLESYDQVGAALVVMKKALELRPGGPFIKKKIEEYSLKNTVN